MDIKQIKSIIKDFEKSNITFLEIESKELKIKLKKGNYVDEFYHEKQTVVDTSQENIKKETVKEEKIECNYQVKSPLVGTFYIANSPNDAPFVNVGDFVKKGQTIAIIEAMKIMNEITAPINGVIKTINLNNGAPVGYDQVLMTIVE